MVFFDRSRRADVYPWLIWKVRLFVVGAVLAVGGMALEMDWLVAVAITILIAAFGIRFLPEGTGSREDGEESSEERSR